MVPEHLFLIGYRGSGKSSVGPIVAELLGRPFLDTDASIEQAGGRSILELFQQEGEQAFRDLESDAIAQTADLPSSVVSLGGGAILRESNRNRIRSLGRTVWLQASPDRLAERIAMDQQRGARRPSLTGADPVEEIERVLSLREPLYRSVSEWAIETEGLTPLEVARSIMHWYASLQGV